MIDPEFPVSPMLAAIDSKDEVLVVEDSAVQRVFVEHLLSRAGYAVHTANTAREGYRLALAVTPALILLDIGLPDEDGLSLCRRMRGQSSLQDVPILMITARDESEAMVTAFEAGAVDYVIKPFKSAVLLARVATHCRLGRLSRQMRRGLDAGNVERDRMLRRLRELHSLTALAEQRQQSELAQALHDSPLQQLNLAKTLLDLAQAQLNETIKTDADEPDPCAGLQQQLQRSSQLLGETAKELRTLCFDLGMPLLHQAGLRVAVEALATKIAEEWGFACRVKLTGVDKALDEATLITCYHGARELLNNVGKHAAATRCCLTLNVTLDRLLLVVADDGIGPDARAEKSPGPSVGNGSGTRGPVIGASGGFGLLSLRSRVELLGGFLLLRRRDPHGTEARLTIPLAKGG